MFWELGFWASGFWSDGFWEGDSQVKKPGGVVKKRKRQKFEVDQFENVIKPKKSDDDDCFILLLM